MQTERYIYFTSTIVIIYFAKLNQQKYYLEHLNEIISIAQGQHCIATGELAQKPEIHVWDPVRLTNICVIKGQHLQGIHFLSFLKKDSLIVSCGVRIVSPIFIHCAKTGSLMVSTFVQDQIVAFVPVASYIGNIAQVTF